MRLVQWNFPANQERNIISRGTLSRSIVTRLPGTGNKMQKFVVLFWDTQTTILFSEYTWMNNCFAHLRDVLGNLTETATWRDICKKRIKMVKCCRRLGAHGNNPCNSSLCHLTYSSNSNISMWWSHQRNTHRRNSNHHRFCLRNTHKKTQHTQQCSQ